LLRSERSSLRRFLALYWLLVILVLTFASYLYYQSRERIMLLEQKARMVDYAADQIKRLRHLHNHFPQERRYPRDPRFRSAIYDLEHVQIFSTLSNNAVDFVHELYRRDGVIHFVKILDNYYLGTKYLFIEIPEDRAWLHGTLKKIAIAWMLALIVLATAGVYLARLFVRPMRRSIELLDRFIRDTTHELNTPLSAMLANMEMIDASRMEDSGLRKRLERIEMAARTVSTLYDDLKYVTLEGERPPKDERFDLSALLRERLEYFDLMFRSKEILLNTSIEPVEITADRRLMARVIDNLLSNAVKYNRRGGEIDVQLRKGELTIRDRGRGMAPEELREIFERYRRFDEVEGGFGLGLDIVKRILDHYGYLIDIASQKGEGTRVTIRWEEKR